MTSKPNIEIAVITGSVRPGNYTSKAAALVIDELEGNHAVRVTVMDPAKLQLPYPGIDGGAADARYLRLLALLNPL